ncbi:hypothetical protein [Spirochaeta cellobiosiphila]|uniref:hypothetical protein n=1 Tax=Spirochaeta cellobiosiphila TaxID=504483 RepID=UPI00041A5A03|nr:hypothetical protein [Spirochaeta cellobiosiphila]
MKRFFGLVLGLILAGMVVSCASSPKETNEPASAPLEVVTKRPEIIDHKNYAWGKDVPEWVLMDISELEKLDKYEDVYLFKLESPRGKSLEGLKMWTEDFQAASDVVKMIDTRVRAKFSGAAVGDLDDIEAYMEKVVTSLSEASISGLKKEGDYWVLRRYFTPEGDVDEDAYTYVYLYSIQKDLLDEQIQDAMDGVEAEPETKVRAKDLVQEALNELE